MCNALKILHSGGIQTADLLLLKRMHIVAIQKSFVGLAPSFAFF
jgi:hypothetical protein